MSGIRVIPPDDFLKMVVSIFVPNPDLTHILEIHLSFLNQNQVIEQFIPIYPELSLYYYPSKLELLWNRLSFQKCVCILRQLLRKKGFLVTTKTLKNKDKLIILRPPIL